MVAEMSEKVLKSWLLLRKPRWVTLKDAYTAPVPNIYACSSNKDQGDIFRARSNESRLSLLVQR